MGIYKRKQESKKTGKQELDQESDQEKKKVFLFFFINSHLGYRDALRISNNAVLPL